MPYGNYQNPTIIEYQHLCQVSDLIKNVKFRCLDYTQSIVPLSPNDFFYLDPPYVPENAKSFTQYTKNGFNKDDHNQLFSILHHLECKFILSNADVCLVRDNFVEPKFHVESIICKRAINSKKPNSKATEVIIRNYLLTRLGLESEIDTLTSDRVIKFV